MLVRAELPELRTDQHERTPHARTHHCRSSFPVRVCAGQVASRGEGSAEQAVASRGEGPATCSLSSARRITSLSIA